VGIFNVGLSLSLKETGLKDPIKRSVLSHQSLTPKKGVASGSEEAMWPDRFAGAD
jgi:hypothetical protein